MVEASSLQVVRGNQNSFPLLLVDVKIDWFRDFAGRVQMELFGEEIKTLLKDHTFYVTVTGVRFHEVRMSRVTFMGKSTSHSHRIIESQTNVFG
jgi:hypothetical protein